MTMTWEDVEANEARFYRRPNLSKCRRVFTDGNGIFRIERDYPLTHPAPWIYVYLGDGR